MNVTLFVKGKTILITGKSTKNR